MNTGQTVQSILTMKNALLLALFAALIAPGCDTLRSTGSTSSTGNKANKGTGNERSAKAPVTYNSSSKDRNVDYVSQYGMAAVHSMDRIGVPASIVLAQGMLESAAGTSDLAMEANNHFGIKCSGTWDGKTFRKKDDDRDSDGNLVESCFRSYESVEESFIDHGKFLRDPRKSNRYGFLFNLDRTDYRGWANGLQAAGYATAPDYADKLITLIERYRLYEYDAPGSKPSTRPSDMGGPGQGSTSTNTGSTTTGSKADASSRIGRVNDVKVVASREGETLEDVARAFQLNTQKVADYNDRGYAPGVKLKPNTRIYIQRKADKWHGRSTEHTVREGQTMFDIAQVYGIQLDELLEMNGMRRGQVPETNEVIRIRGKNRYPVRIKEGVDDTVAGSAEWPGGDPKPNRSPVVEDGELDFEIGPGRKYTPSGETRPETEKPAPTTWPSSKPPATSDRPYDYDPTPSTKPTSKPPQPFEDESDQAAPRGYHRVVKGDTLYRLSKEYGLTVDRLKQLNNLQNSDIKIGQLLKVQ